jgi:hypothetical protein
MAKKVIAPVKKTRTKKIPQRVATKEEIRALSKQLPPEEPEEEEIDGVYEGEDDFYITFTSVQANQIIVCFEQMHHRGKDSDTGSVGIAIAKIIEHTNPDASFQELLVDHVDKEYKYYTLMLATN